MRKAFLSVVSVLCLEPGRAKGLLDGGINTEDTKDTKAKAIGFGSCET
jgi:hypothetical protein